LPDESIAGEGFFDFARLQYGEVKEDIIKFEQGGKIIRLRVDGEFISGNS